MEISAQPTKEFFIDMITRDIQIEKAILDLIDNCIDGARKEGDFNGKFIKLIINDSEFVIEDNCGGFSIEIAEEYAFKFGRSSKPRAEEENYSIGRFGVGMKRALFKMGKNFCVESKTAHEHFKVSVDVEKWKQDDTTWKLELEEIIDEDGSAWKGTKIRVWDLKPDIKEVFGRDNIMNLELDNEIAYSYAKLINEGLKIYVNGKAIAAKDIEILSEEGKIQPAYDTFTVDDVEVTIIAGISNSVPRDAGWYIYCNDRLVLLADKTSTTGWKTKDQEMKIPQYHADFAMFRGVVFMKSTKVERLPLTTTKVGVDTEAHVYRCVYDKMRKIMKPIFEFLKNLDYKEQKDSICKEYEKDEIFALKENIEYSWIQQGHFKYSINLEEFKENERNSRIIYSRPRSEVEKVRKALNVTKNEDIGIKTFEYYCELENL